VEKAEKGGITADNKPGGSLDAKVHDVTKGTKGTSKSYQQHASPAVHNTTHEKGEAQTVYPGALLSGLHDPKPPLETEAAGVPPEAGAAEGKIGKDSHSKGSPSNKTPKQQGAGTKIKLEDSKKSLAKQKTNKVAGDTEDSITPFVQGVVEGLIDASMVRTDPCPLQKEHKKPPKSVSRVAAPFAHLEEGSTQVRREGLEDTHIPFLRQGSTMLLVFNIHDTLLDCSCIDERNPNSSIRPTMTTETRRVVCTRPWLSEFFNRSFLNFTVAFWGIKSDSYMADLVPSLLGRLRGDKGFAPLFVWSARDCVPIEFDDGEPIVWGKPLERVFQQWPWWNFTNTVIVDHNASRVGCNPIGNIIIPTPFYVECIAKLSDDQNFLKSSFWPLLQGLYGCRNIEDFQDHFPESFLNSKIKVPKLHEKAPRPGNVEQHEGEGTREPRSSN
jgi:hypothetical protein